MRTREHTQPIHIVRRGAYATVYVGGVELLWVAREPVTVKADPDGLTEVTLTLLSDRVTVDDSTHERGH